MATTLDTWSTEELSDGRIGIFKNGICQGVVRSPEEVGEWFNERNRGKKLPPTDALYKAIRKMG